MIKSNQNHSLSLFEVLFEGVGEPLGVLDKLPLPLLQGQLPLGARDVGAHVVHRVQQLLDGTRDLPGKGKREHKEKMLKKWIMNNE